MDITNINFVSQEAINFETILSSIRKEPTDDPQFLFSQLYITTITVISNIESQIDLSVAYLNLKDKYDLTYQPDRSAPPPQGKRMFYNCMKWEKILRDGDTTMKVSSKIFPNGKFQYAGFKNFKALTIVPRIMMQELRNTQKNMTGVIMSTPQIVQINSTFYILREKGKYWKILQSKLHNLLLKTQHTSVGGRVLNSTFKPEKYPGINVKFKCANSDKQITILIFSTGSALINGGNNLEDYRDAYNMVCNLVLEHRTVLLVKNLI